MIISKFMGWLFFVLTVIEIVAGKPIEVTVGFLIIAVVYFESADIKEAIKSMNSSPKGEVDE